MKKFLSVVLVLGSFATAKAFVGQDDLEYFKQFIYVIDTDNTDPDFPTSSYHFVMTKWDHQIPISKTQYLTQSMGLFMHEDGTFSAYYSENLHTVGQQGFFPKGCRPIKGTWSVPNKKLILTRDDGTVLIEADRFMENGQHAMMFTFMDSIMDPALKGQKISAGAAQGSSEEQQAQFCW